MTLLDQVLVLLVLAIPTACIAWTVTHEEVFRELREYCERRSDRASNLWQRKFFYLFTCEYCFSHYVALLVVIVCGFSMVFRDIRGYAIAWFSLVWVANLYMSAFGRLRLDIKRERVEIEEKQEEVEQIKDGKWAA
ncbi:MAG TPA: hypothetical protein VM009_00240 [Terriglobales bacterium]|nr:hypothetical protein [Terriglobales bacterium]